MHGEVSKETPAMTPADEAQFIALWNQGLTCPEIAQRLTIPPGTARSRAYHLQQRGRITARPKGGKRVRPWTVHAAVQDSAVHAPMHGAVPVHNSAEILIPAALAAELGCLWAAIDALRQDMHRPVQDTVQSLPEPLFDDPADNATERWNLYLKRGLRVRIEGLARARGIAPSRVVQEILWQALSDRRAAEAFDVVEEDETR
jgi:hypothetical protein